MTRLTYILDKNGNPIAEPDLIKWATWFENKENRKIDYTELKDIHISTIFLGLDHNFHDSNKPLLYETLPFENKISTIRLQGKTFKIQKSLDNYQERYSTKEEALKGHKKIVQQLILAGYRLK